MSSVIFFFIWLGFKHILPDGFDHILFILGLFLLNPRLKPVLLQATCFTIAHTITLILSAKNIIVFDPDIVEPLISLSIVFIAIENIFIKEVKPWRYAIVFIFGLIHGLGFAGALKETSIDENTFYSSLISFNIGVELGQFAVIFLAYFIIGKWYANESWYSKKILYPLSILIGIIAIYLTLIRI